MKTFMNKIFGPRKKDNHMELVGSGGAETINEALQEARARDAELEAKTIRMVLMGTANSGKSTLMRQLREPDDEDAKLTDEEISYRRSFQKPIRACIIKGMQDLIRLTEEQKEDLSAVGDQVQVVMGCEVPKAKKNRVWANETIGFSNEIAAALSDLWAHPQIAETWIHSQRQGSTPDTLWHFFEGDLSRFVGDEYLPTRDDVIFVRDETTAAEQLSFDHNDFRWILYDVGGAERFRLPDWEDIAKNTQAIVWVVSLASYCRSVMDVNGNPTGLNALDESFQAFEDMLNASWMPNLDSIHLFFNKLDLVPSLLEQVLVDEAARGFDVGNQDAQLEARVNNYNFAVLSEFEKRAAVVKSTLKLISRFSVATDRAKAMASMNAVIDHVEGAAEFEGGL